MNNPKEFTQDEFNRFVEKNNLEVFTKAQVDAFSKDVIEKSKNKEIDEFEIACCAADYMSLKPVFVRSNDLMKSLMFYREAQREPVEIPDGIFKSIDDRMCFCYKETPLNILKGIVGINCADDVAIEKAKALPLGTEKMYGGKLYVKTEKGWRLKKKGMSSEKKEVEESKSSKDEKQSSVSKSELDNSGDGSVINVKYAQTGNIAISFTKKEGKWFSKNTMTRSDIQMSPEQVVKTLEKYSNKKVYSTKADLKDTKAHGSSSAKDLVKQIAKDEKLSFEELWNAVKEDYSEGGIDSISKRDVYEIIDASGISPKKANKKEASNEKSVKQKTSSFLGDYDRALMENFRLKKELFNAEEESKYRSKNDSFYLPLEKLKKTEWYENQLNKIKESENKLSKIKAEKPEELDKDAIKSELKIMNDGQDWFENRVKSFREKGYDKSDDEKERNLWREATDDIKRREIYTQFVQSLLKD